MNILKQKTISVIPDKGYLGTRDATLLADLKSNATNPINKDGNFIITMGDHWLHGYAWWLVEII